MNQEPLGMLEMSNEEYHAAPGISSTQVKSLVDKSLLHYWHDYVRPDRVPEEQTEAMRFGTAAHTAVLEPDLFTARYVAAPDDAPGRPIKRSINAKRPSPQTVAAMEYWADFDEDNKGKIALTSDDYGRCLAIRDRIRTHPVTAGLLTGGRAELSFFAHQTVMEARALVKCRPDYIHDNGYAMIDLKSTRNAEPGAFGKDIGKLLYDISAAWYLDVVKAYCGEAPKHFIWLAVESEAPHAISLHFATPQQITAARAVAQLQLQRLVEALTSNHWPDWADEVLPAQIPGWIRR